MSFGKCEECGIDDDDVIEFDENMCVIGGIHYFNLHQECLDRLEKKYYGIINPESLND